MEVQVAISPELGVELAAFAKQWNDNASSRAAAYANYVENSPKELAAASGLSDACPAVAAA